MNILNDLKFGKNIIGVDEVGRGCLAGPVFAAAIKLDQKNFPEGINDSKKLNKSKRLEIFKALIKKCEYSVGISSVKEIEELNILQSSLLAMNRALKKIKFISYSLSESSSSTKVETSCSTNSFDFIYMEILPKLPTLDLKSRGKLLEAGKICIVELRPDNFVIRANWSVENVA